MEDDRIMKDATVGTLLEDILWNSKSENPLVSTNYGYRVYRVNESQVILFRATNMTTVEYIGTVLDGKGQTGAIVDMILKHIVSAWTEPDVIEYLHDMLTEGTSKITYQQIQAKHHIHSQTARDLRKGIANVGGN